MNRAGANLKSEPATIENAEFIKGLGKSSSGCCCDGSNQTINIGRNKTMNETREDKTVTTVTAPEIVCGGCASSIKKALGAVSGVSEVDVDVATKKVTITHSGDVLREKIVDALDRAGYSVAS